MSRTIEKLSGLVVVTGGSSGIGLELAKRAARDGCDLLLVARNPMPEAVAEVTAAGAASVETVEGDLATRDGIVALLQAVGDRPVAALFANAGAGEGGLFLDQQWHQIAQTLHTNITGTVALVYNIGRKMQERGAGRILVTGSIAGHIPGPFNLVYNSTKAFIDDFCIGLANEVKDSGVTVTCLLPGATGTAFFERAEMEDTKLAKAPKADPAKVAQDGYNAMLKGESHVVSGFMNKVQDTFAGLLPDDLLAQMHRKLARPDGS
ncbi:SDR family NAD(P)-dependent oxidoreductase [Croceicoccus sp. F390]|uniref:SDR family NAD(P)-dependent oxidoreductase n=1 Tax=Croceicoccus esteveae TaxID=3075597 RepID=A0ABU2ZHW2_9SPHN|nr:SDR family NAD(P)-dependent oxidoreductase [Croceicoccus sp. F390]MDT0576202.1 SDR family NAD(P)-dependent oxidoreductase [Croceicoccus sp. F390]